MKQFFPNLCCIIMFGWWFLLVDTCVQIHVALNQITICKNLLHVNIYKYLSFILVVHYDWRLGNAPALQSVMQHYRAEVASFCVEY